MGALDELKRIVAETESRAYQRGWDDAVAHILAAARETKTPRQISMPLGDTHTEDGPPQGERPMIDEVYNWIRLAPGTRGAAIVNAVFHDHPQKDRKSLDRTVRTALMRLKKRGAIENRNGAWYPKEAA